jgi:hypothetical protein
MIIAVRSQLLGFGSHISRLLVAKEDHEEISRIITQRMEQILSNLKPADPGAIRARNRKLKEYTDILAAFDEGGKARVRDRSKSNGTESEP